MDWEVFHVMRYRDFSITRHLHPAGSRQSVGGRLGEPGHGTDPTARIRRLNRCQICGRELPDQRVFCWYCVQYVH